MAEEIVEVPIDEPQETVQERGLSSGLTPEASAPEGETALAREEIAQEAVPKAKPRGRPKGVKDAKPRAKPKARAPPPQPAEGSARRIAARIPANPPSDSESSLDEATLHETTLMHIMRGVQQYRHTQKNQKSALYASWFGR